MEGIYGEIPYITQGTDSGLSFKRECCVGCVFHSTKKSKLLLLSRLRLRGIPINENNLQCLHVTINVETREEYNHGDHVDNHQHIHPVRTLTVTPISHISKNSLT